MYTKIYIDGKEYVINGHKLNNSVISDAITDPEPNLEATVSVAENAMTEQMNEEFASLFQAIAVAVFLVFVVMAAQFESPKFSFMS